MPRTTSRPTPASREPAFCEVCGALVARRTDIPRHMRRHLSAEEKALESYACPFPGCTYTSLQKGNVGTHLRTHTKEKNQHCPSCNFVTVDPGSLTRHRKRRHQYVPKPRKPRARSAYENGSPSAGVTTGIIIETPATYAEEGPEPSEASLSVPSSPSHVSSALDLGYESDATDTTQSTTALSSTDSDTSPSLALSCDEAYPFEPSRPSRRLRISDILSDESQNVYWNFRS